MVHLTAEQCIINKDRKSDILGVISHQNISSSNTEWFEKNEEKGYRLLHELKEYYLIAQFFEDRATEEELEKGSLTDEEIYEISRKSYLEVLKRRLKNLDSSEIFKGEEYKREKARLTDLLKEYED